MLAFSLNRRVFADPVGGGGQTRGEKDESLLSICSDERFAEPERRGQTRTRTVVCEAC
jgi:hypothetical protein